jgi:hypothetical protein
MKLIMENWKHYLKEQDLEDPRGDTSFLYKATGGKYAISLADRAEKDAYPRPEDISDSAPDAEEYRSWLSNFWKTIDDQVKTYSFPEYPDLSGASESVEFLKKEIERLKQELEMCRLEKEKDNTGIITAR